MYIYIIYTLLYIHYICILLTCVYHLRNAILLDVKPRASCASLWKKVGCSPSSCVATWVAALTSSVEAWLFGISGFFSTRKLLRNTYCGGQNFSKELLSTSYWTQMLFLKTQKSQTFSTKSPTLLLHFITVLHHKGGAAWFGHFLILVLAIEKVGPLENSVVRWIFWNKSLPTLSEPHKKKTRTFHYAACLKGILILAYEIIPTGCHPWNNA